MKATVLNGLACGMCGSDLLLLADNHPVPGDVNIGTLTGVVAQKIESFVIKCCNPSCMYGSQEMMRDYSCASTGKIKVK